MPPPFVGRRKPYTQIGIRRIPCIRCGKRSYASWQACANGGRHLPMCKDCDILVNQMFLDFMRVPNASALMAAYRRKVRAAPA